MSDESTDIPDFEEEEEDLKIMVSYGKRKHCGMIDIILTIPHLGSIRMSSTEARDLIYGLNKAADEVDRLILNG